MMILPQPSTLSRGKASSWEEVRQDWSRNPEDQTLGTTRVHASRKSPRLRRAASRWAMHLLHSHNVVQSDRTTSGGHEYGPQDLGLRFCDFGGSFIDGSRATVFPGVRYRLLSLVSRLGQAPLLSTVEEDLFALGSTIYFTVTGSAPYEEVADEDEVEKFFRECTFTDLVDVPCADIIALCWKQGAKSAQLVAEKIRRASPAGI